MSETDFPPYRTTHNKKAFESRRSLPDELQPILEDIEHALANDPYQSDHEDRVTADPEDGKRIVYTHPDPEVQVTFKVSEKEKVLYFYHYTAPAFKRFFIMRRQEDGGRIRGCSYGSIRRIGTIPDR